MNAFFKRLLPAVLLLAAALVAVSCDEDSDSGKSDRKSQIVGHWYEVYSEDGEVRYDIETYNADGTFEKIGAYPDGEVEFYSSGTYIYKRGELITTTLAGEDIGAFTCTVTIKDDVLYVEEEDGDTYVLQRMSDEMYNSLVGSGGPGAPSSSIVGHWHMEDVEDGAIYHELLTFSANGRFEEIVIYGESIYGWPSEQFSGRYELSGSKLSMDYDDDETVTVTVEKVSASALVLRQGSDERTFSRMSEDEYDRWI